MSDYSQKSCLVYDNGLFVNFAQKLSKEFGRVYYTTPWNGSAFPKSNARLIGQGIPGLTWTDSIFDVINSVDVFVFPDCYAGGLQEHLESIGKLVFGSKRGDELELYREAAKRYFEKINLPVGKYKVIIGLDSLRAFLKSHENQFVKIEITRGDMETFYAKNYRLIEPRLDELEHNLGALKYIQKFICEDAIEGVECGIDAYTIDGCYPKSVMAGIEVKDRCYVAKVVDYATLPGELTEFCNAIAPAFKMYRYRNFFSTENRITSKKVSYMNDFCSRLGSPPSELYQDMFDNLGDIIWYGANGECVDPVVKCKYGAEVLILSSWADQNWQAVEFPPEIANQVKLRNAVRIKDKYYAMPQSVGVPEIGAVVATGDSLDEAIKKVKDYCSQVEGFYIETPCDGLECAVDELNKLKDFGVNLLGE